MKIVGPRTLLLHPAARFGWRDALRGRPFEYDFRLPDLDPSECSMAYELVRQLAGVAVKEGVDPGFYPEGEPSKALVALVRRELEWGSDERTGNLEGVTRRAA